LVGGMGGECGGGWRSDLGRGKSVVGGEGFVLLSLTM
jgi:hypothetical protein